MVRRFKRALLLAVLAVLALVPHRVDAQHAYPSAWYSCRLTLSRPGTVQHRVCRTHPITRHHRPIVGWRITRSRLSARIERSVRYPRFQLPPPLTLPSCFGPLVTRWSAPVFAAARLTGIPSSTIAAVIKTESSGLPSLTSSTGAEGLMQVEPATALDYGFTGNLYDPAYNIRVGSFVLADDLRLEGTMRAALAAYNAGPGNLPAGEGYAETVLSRICS